MSETMELIQVIVQILTASIFAVIAAYIALIMLMLRGSADDY